MGREMFQVADSEAHAARDAEKKRQKKEEDERKYQELKRQGKI